MNFAFWGRVKLFGVVLWLVAFLTTAIVSALGLGGQSVLAGILLALVTLLSAWALGSRISFVSVSQGVTASILWVIVNLILDYLVIVLRFSEGRLDFFLLWTVWLRYALLLVIPILLASRRRTNA